ncbi:MAG: hypothetical protein AD742_17180 [Methylibium sp. NZG]|nr:MAG: hypothetical protein AD742_17180 [Methylibium sp. NZG]
MVLKLTAGQIEALTWVLIFGGMLALALGLVVSRSDAALGIGIAVVAGVAIVVGVVLIYVRSRMNPSQKNR